MSIVRSTLRVVAAVTCLAACGADGASATASSRTATSGDGVADPSTTTASIGLTPIGRVLYTDGVSLSAADYTAEQAYFLEKSRRHNRVFHTPGVVGGLSVIRWGSVALVAPGAALDRAGNEIDVDNEAVVTLPTSGTDVYLVLSYSEYASNPVPTPMGTVNTRTIESHTFGFSSTKPTWSPTPWSPTDTTPPVPLAHFVMTSAGWTLDGTFVAPVGK